MDEAQIRQMWEALAAGDLGPAAAALAPDARWRAVEDGPWNCEGRTAILDVLSQSLAHGLSGRVESVEAVSGRRIVAFRPDERREAPWPLDDGIRYVVLTLRGEQIVELKGCADRAAALAYAGA
jgi:SnoaL-like domain